ncbi:MAG TPA: hypothetical protein VFJ82_12415 [Longimicrobium sp.]|nr:hypothetical protein [Longimicrobium sp.]
MKPAHLAVVTLAVLAAAPAAAQRRAAAFATAPPAPSLAPGDTVLEGLPRPRDPYVVGRAGTGALGWVLGAIAGGFVGAGISEATGHTDVEWGNLPGVVIGAAAGGTLGAGVGAASPRFGASCGFGKRLADGVLGSVGGALVGAGLTAITDEGAVALTIPIGSAVGAALAAGC